MIQLSRQSEHSRQNYVVVLTLIYKLLLVAKDDSKRHFCTTQEAQISERRYRQNRDSGYDHINEFKKATNSFIIYCHLKS